MVPKILSNGEPFISRNELVRLLGYKSIHGFEKWRKRHTTFPSPVKRVAGFNAKTFFMRDEVLNWWNKFFDEEVCPA